MPSLQLHQEKDKHLFVSKPINSIETLHDWNPNTATDISNIANVKLQQRQKNTEPKLLVCHDMAGGYKEDNWVQGKNSKTIYSINYWQFIDTFVYFSHGRVNIPPVVWTNACHRNGVLSLGTFLVEGEDGTVELERLFYGYKSVEKNDDPMQLWSPYYADKLVELTKFYGFDGWLFNIESNFTQFPIPPQFKATQLSEFLGYFQEKLHTEIPGSKVIWYDSLTEEGKVDWQSQLNKKNKMFFEKSDGIFLNYWWKKDYPEKAKEVANELGRSEQDVYFGIDVWGRNTFGGGKFNSSLGVEGARKYGLSSAIFAPAWTYEHFGTEKFERMDKKLWLGDHDHPGIANTIKPAPAPEKSWFSTFFDRGFGSAYYFNGKKILDQTWSHLSHQSILPSYSNVKLDEDDAFIGGTSVILHDDNKYTALYKLLLEMNDEFQLQYVYKPLNEDQNDFVIKCQLSVEISNTNSNTANISSIINFNEDSTDSEYISIINSDSSLSSSSTTILNNGWMMKTIQFKNTSSEVSTMTINELGFTIENKNSNVDADKQSLNGAIRFGLINIIPTHNSMYLINTTNLNNMEPFEWKDTHWETIENENNKKYNKNKNEEKEEIKKYRFWGTLNWKQNHDNNNNNNRVWNQIYFSMISIMGNNNSNNNNKSNNSNNSNSDYDDVFLGTSFSSQYRISGLDLNDTNHSLRLLIQHVNFLGQIETNNTIPFPNYPSL